MAWALSSSRTPAPSGPGYNVPLVTPSRMPWLYHPNYMWFNSKEIVVGSCNALWFFLQDLQVGQPMKFAYYVTILFECFHMTKIYVRKSMLWSSWFIYNFICWNVQSKYKHTFSVLKYSFTSWFTFWKVVPISTGAHLNFAMSGILHIWPPRHWVRKLYSNIFLA